MSEDSHEQVLQDLKSFIADTKVLLDKVLKMRVQGKEAQMNLLRLFHPKCIEILEISNELSSKNSNQINKNNKATRMKIKKGHKVHFEK